MAFKHGDHKHDTVEQARACAAGESVPETPKPEDPWGGWPETGGCLVTPERDDDTTDYEAIHEARMEARRDREEDAWDRYHERQAYREPPF